MADHDSPDRAASNGAKKNVALPPDFGARLSRLREERHLSKTDLADAAGVTYRTIQNLETDRRDRALQRTLLAVAQALSISYDELMDRSPGEPPLPLPPPPSRRPLYAVLATLLIMLAGAGGWLWFYSTTHAEIVIEDGRLFARDPVFGRRLWGYAGASDMRYQFHPPWSDDIVVVSGVSAGDEQSVQMLERRTGRVLWQAGPDVDLMKRALNAEDFAGAGMNCGFVGFADVDGDGRAEIVGNFHHGRYYPSAVCLFDQEGTLLRQYASKGHTIDLLIADFDVDGRDEVLVTATNNDPAYGGPTAIMLDDLHWRGATVDSLCNPWSDEPDSSLYRVVFPNLPGEYLAVAQCARFAAKTPGFIRSDDDAVYWFMVSGRAPFEEFMKVTLDSALRPLTADCGDNLALVLAGAGADSLRGRGPDDPAWREAWLASAARFGAGVEAEIAASAARAAAADPPPADR